MVMATVEIGAESISHGFLFQRAFCGRFLVTFSCEFLEKGMYITLIRKDKIFELLDRHDYLFHLNKYLTSQFFTLQKFFDRIQC